ncbi:exodeoxyribonuclease VII large subunit [Aquella oligotrophica]|uniref:Exonuclease VII large subunit C-terminal domain-containing protein n=1 Tax=Aquella oligotrophica TaxID=2067065 RepID=A0A2I7N6N1_9NEIS|nr:exodeoxyribonuclease VII large subunit [Aquella oligotrophica]AUR52090.1 hypothetical protein CUN60_07175 [Aquella oligotrophica]
MLLNKPLSYLIDLYNGNLSKLVTNAPESQSFLFETTAVIVGIPNKAYKNTLYYKIAEEETNSKDSTISVAIDKQFADFKLSDKVKIIGQFYVGFYNGGLQLNIKAEMMELVDSRLTQQDSISAIDVLKSFPKKRVPFPFSKPLNIALIQPISNTSVQDFMKKLPSEGIYLKNYPTNISSKTAILDCIQSILKDNQNNPYKYNILAVIRGGGDGFEVFDDLDVCRAFANIDMHKIVGLGHEENRCLIEFVSDHAEATPSYLTTYLVHQLDSVVKNKLQTKYYNNKSKTTSVPDNKLETKLNWIIGFLIVLIVIISFKVL